MSSVKDWAIIAARAASEKKATDIMVIDVAGVLVVTDYFILATGNTPIQVRAIADEVEEHLREEAGLKPVGREGVSEGRWVLLDYGDFVVHVFQPEERDFYRLEKLWGDAPRVKLPDDIDGQAGKGSGPEAGEAVVEPTEAESADAALAEGDESTPAEAE